MKKLILLAVFLAGAFADTSEAQVRLLGLTSSLKPTVLSVLKDSGCHPDWLSKAMSDSRLQSLRPKPGTRIILKEERCTGTPPSDVVRRSRALRSPRPKAAAVARSEKAESAAATNQSEVRLKALQAENASLKAESEKLGQELSRLRLAPKPLPALAGEKHSGGVLAGAAVALLLTGALAMFFGLFLRDGNRVSYPKTWKVKDGSVEYAFKFQGSAPAAPGASAIVGRYKCLKCEAVVEGKKSALEEHARKECPAGRVTSNVKTPVP